MTGDHQVPLALATTPDGFLLLALKSPPTDSTPLTHVSPWLMQEMSDRTFAADGMHSKQHQMDFYISYYFMFKAQRPCHFKKKRKKKASKQPSL